MSKRSQFLKNQQTSLIQILDPYIKIDLQIRSKNLILTEDFEKSVEEAIKTVENGKTNRIAIPQSTDALARFGPVVIQIMNNPDDYITVSTVKRRSQRAGSKGFHLQSWDKRTIESTLKKTPRTGCKTDKDENYIKRFNNEAEEIIKLKDWQKLLDLSNLQGNFFVQRDSREKEFFTSIINYAEELNEEKEKIDQNEKEIDQIQEEESSLANSITIINKEIDEVKHTFEKSEDGQIYSELENERSLALTNPKISNYIKLLQKFTHTFVNFIEKQQVDMQATVKLLYDLELDPLAISEQQLTDDFPSLVNDFINHAEQAFKKKKWYRKAAPSSPSDLTKYFLKSKGYSLWQDLLVITKRQMDVKKRQPYQNLQAETQQRNERRKEIEGKKEKLISRIARKKADIGEYKERIVSVEERLTKAVNSY